jgi:hypothetical protein
MKIKISGSSNPPKTKKMYTSVTDSATGETVAYKKKIKTTMPSGSKEQIGRSTITYSKKKIK